MGIENIVKLEHKKYVAIDPSVKYELPVPCAEIRLKGKGIAAFPDVNPAKGREQIPYPSPEARYVQAPHFRWRVKGPDPGELDWYDWHNELILDSSGDPGTIP